MSGDPTIIGHASHSARLPLADAGRPGPLVKICGLTRIEDVKLAWALGAWALGFVFALSPRRVSPGAAHELIRQASQAMGELSARAGTGRSAHPVGGVPEGVPGRGRPYLVGVFTDVTAAEIAEVVVNAGVDAVQLHGMTGPGGEEVRREAARWGVSPLIIRAVPVDPEETDVEALREQVAEARAQADVVLLDTKASGRFGGTGRSFGWALAQQVLDGLPLFIAGGITADNAGTALRISGAWGLDVSSGVEQAPGIKDPVLMRRLFVEAVAASGSAITGNDTDARQHVRQEGPDR